MKRLLQLVTMMLISIMLLTAPFAAETLRGSLEEAPSAGCRWVGVPGTVEKADSIKILARINQIRKEACDKGYPNPEDPSQKLKASDYRAVVWNKDMEEIALTRAVEATILRSHTRPNGTTPFSVVSGGSTADEECLAWNYTGILHGIEQWYGEKSDWVKQSTGETTGHYESLINPSVASVGVTGFTAEDGGWETIAGEFSYDQPTDTGRGETDGEILQIIEVQRKYLSGAKISGSAALVVGQKSTYRTGWNINYGAENLYSNMRFVTAPGETRWTSSDLNVFSVSSDGTVTAVGVGSAVLSASVGTVSCRMTVQVTNPKAGSRIVKGKCTYTVIKGGTALELTRCTASGTVRIPAYIRIYDKRYPVTRIGKGAFRGNASVTGVVISKQVTSIGMRAFYQCSSLQRVTLKTSKLIKGSIGKRAFFTGTATKIKVPRAKKRIYKNLLKRSVMSQNVTIQ